MNRTVMYNSAPPRVQYVIESDSSERHSSSFDTSAERGCFNRASSKRRSAKFKNARTPPLKKKLAGAVAPIAANDDEQKSTSTIQLSESVDSSRGEKNLSRQKLVKESARRPKKINRIQCLKFTIFGCVMVSLLVNFGLLALGTFLKADPSFSQFLSENYRQTTETKFTAPSLYKGTYALIALSFAAIIINFSGCCGVIQNSLCVLGMYFATLIVLFLFQLSVGLLWLFRRDAIENEVAVALDYMVQHYYQGPGIVQEVLDSIQTLFRCCGNAGCGDFQSLRLTVPRTCDLDCYGCRDRMFRVLRDGFTAIYIFGLAMILAELIAIMCVMFLICRLKYQPAEQPIVYQIRLPDYIDPENYNNQPDSIKYYDENRKNSKKEIKQQLEPKIEAKYYEPAKKGGEKSSPDNKVVYIAYPVHKMTRKKVVK